MLFLQSIVVLLDKDVAFKVFICPHPRELTQCQQSPSCSGGVPESPSEGDQSLPCFFPWENVNLSKGKSLPKSAEAALIGPLSQEGNLRSVLRGSIPSAQHCLQPPLLSAEMSRLWDPGKGRSQMIFCFLVSLRGH